MKEELAPVEGTIMAGLAEAIETSAKLGERAAVVSFKPKVEVIGKTETKILSLSHLRPDAPAQILKEDRPRQTRTLEFSSLTSFAEAIADECTSRATVPIEGDGRCAVLVSKGSINAYWNMDGHTSKDHFWLPLSLTEQYKALQRLITGVTREELWRLLATDLHGCLPASLELQMMQLVVHEESKDEMKIQPSGITDGGRVTSMRITSVDTKDGPKTAEVKLDYEYRGSVWTCFNEEIVLPLRMVMSNENGTLRFQFFPRGLARILTEHRTALVNAFREQLSGLDCTMPVYQGCFTPEDE